MASPCPKIKKHGASYFNDFFMFPNIITLLTHQYNGNTFLLKGEWIPQKLSKKGGEISYKNVGFEKRGDSVKWRGNPVFLMS